MKLYELYDIRSSDHRTNGDHNLHHSVNSAYQDKQAIASKVSGFYWVVDNKKIAGPFVDKEKADSFKKNRPDRIPSKAIMRKF